MVQGSVKDYQLLLEVFREGLQVGLISREQVIAWADELIVAEDEPEHFLIELSMSSNMDQLIRVLKQYTEPGESMISTRVLLGVLYQKIKLSDISSADALEIYQYRDMYCRLTDLESDRFDNLMDDYYDTHKQVSIKVESALYLFLSTYSHFNLSNYHEWEQISARLDSELAPLMEEQLKERERERKEYEKSIRKNARKRLAMKVLSILTFITCLGGVCWLAIYYDKSALYAIPLIFVAAVRSFNKHLARR